MKNRIDIKKEIERLSPKDDCQRIVFLTSFMEFSWDMTRALELALFRTFAVPSIANLLAKTGEFVDHSQKRYDDTAIIVNEIMVNGYESSRGQEFIKRMNRIHGQYDISNEDFLYTLSTFVFVPIRWIDEFCWRKTYENERLALFYFWREVGERMRITDIPTTYEAFEQFSLNYEKEMFKNVEATQRVANATRDLLLSFYLPKLFWRPAHPLVYALMDETLLSAMGYPKPNVIVKKATMLLMRLRAMTMRALPKRTSPHFDCLYQYPSYPDGYSIKDIGPEGMFKK